MASQSAVNYKDLVTQPDRGSHNSTFSEEGLVIVKIMTQQNGNLWSTCHNYLHAQIPI